MEDDDCLVEDGGRRGDTAVEDGGSKRQTLIGEDEENGLNQTILGIDQTALVEEEGNKRRSVIEVTGGAAVNSCLQSTRLTEVILPFLQQVTGCVYVGL